MKKETVIKHVMLEIENIKKFATKEQVMRLSIEKVFPFSPDRCIYGLMTGNCFSDEAQQLIYKCCSRVGGGIPDEDDDSFYQEAFGIDDCKIKKPSKKDIIVEVTSEMRRFSFLEIYIAYLPQQCENIVRYLKGKTERLYLPL